MAKQSSIEWLYNKMYEHRGNITIEEFEQAKHIHKEEIKDAWNNGMKSDNGHFGTFNQFYQETYERKTTKSK